MSKGTTNKLTVQLTDIQLDDASNQALEQLIRNKTRSIIDIDLRDLIENQIKSRVTENNVTCLIDREIGRRFNYYNIEELAKKSIEDAFKEKYGTDYMDKTTEFASDILTEKVYSIIESTVKQILSRLLKG